MAEQFLVRISVEVPEGTDSRSIPEDQVLVFGDVETAKCAAQAAFEAGAELEPDDV